MPASIGGPIVVSCEVSEDPPYLVNTPVTWNAIVDGGEGALTYEWHGDSGLSGDTISVMKIYQTTGIKRGKIIVTDSVGNSAECPEEEITVIVQPNINEF
jgi:hypothetical protein